MYVLLGESVLPTHTHTHTHTHTYKYTYTYTLLAEVVDKHLTPVTTPGADTLRLRWACSSQVMVSKVGLCPKARPSLPHGLPWPWDPSRESDDLEKTRSRDLRT